MGLGLVLYGTWGPREEQRLWGLRHKLKTADLEAALSSQVAREVSWGELMLLLLCFCVTMIFPAAAAMSGAVPHASHFSLHSFNFHRGSTKQVLFPF